ncbi:hypothetical protein [Emticicia sp. 17c]
MKKNFNNRPLAIKKTTISEFSNNKSLADVFTNVTSRVCSLQNL